MATRNAQKNHQKSAPVITDPDLVDRIFDYLLAEFPQIAGDRFARAKQAVRDEFRGEEVYIAARPLTERQRLVNEVLRLFNGRNAREVARRLGIGKTTVYRIIKQPGGRNDNCPTFPGNGTTDEVRSRTDRPSEQAVGPTETGDGRGLHSD
jgi:hypothetical protein